jgi:hypothetical protein
MASRHGAVPAPGFNVWLARQLGRKDHAGKLAACMLEDPEWPQCPSATSRDYIKHLHDRPESFKMFRESYLEFVKQPPSIYG